MTTLSALSDDLLTNEEAAALLGIKPNTLRARMDRLGVSYGRRRTRPAAGDRSGEH